MVDDDSRSDDRGKVLEFGLPDLGEGLTEAQLQTWSVAVGDQVELNQKIAEVETAKAVVDLPCPFVGTVVELLVETGETVDVGTPLLRIRTESMETSSAEPKSVLVGYGPAEESTTRRRRASASSAGSLGVSGRAAATPGARKLARELGVDLWHVPGSGPDGAVTVDDVRSAVPVAQPAPRGGAATSAATEVNNGGPSNTETAPALSAGERETRTPVSGIRKRTAAAMVASARSIPQAGASVTADVTASVELLDHLRSTTTFTGLGLTSLSLVGKAVLAGLAEHPGINACWDESAQEIVTKYYVNLGIAVAAPSGLLVPNVKEAQVLSLRDLCREIGWVTENARSGSLTPPDMGGGTFTVSNVGVFGVDSGMPLVNPGEGAILCLGAIAERPWVVRNELAIRWVSTLTLSFDHRIIDGELASRFLATVAGLLEDPLTLLSR